jgi:SAM-dependent methyltransferase
VVVSDSRAAGDVPPKPQETAEAHVAWHDLECGGYRADLPLWRELASRAEGPTLDVGAGSGRVSLDLARAGSEVTALDVDPVLLAALTRRAARLALNVPTVSADARSFSLQRRDYGLCAVPMQTIQLLGGAEGRVAFLRCAREHLRPGATVSCAILAALEPFDCSQGTIGPAAERIELDGLLYLSRATRVSELATSIEIERERRVLAEPPRVGALGGDAREQGPERVTIALDRLSAGELERDARAAGLRPLARHEIPATDEHVGSIAVVLGV